MTAFDREHLAMSSASDGQQDVTLDATLTDTRRLLAAVKDLSRRRDLEGVMGVVRVAARELTGADGVTFVLREGDLVFYAEEFAIGPLWKGRRFKASECISGWAIANRRPAVIEDIYEDSRIPIDAYRTTFVRSLAMVPIRLDDPMGAIGAYWASRRLPTQREVGLLQALADATAVALTNVELDAELQRAVRVRDEFISVASHELRTPLTPLLLETQALGRALREGREPRDVRKSAARIESHALRFGRLVDSLLDLSRISRGDLPLSIEDVDLTATVNQVLLGFRERVERAGTEVTVRAPGPVVGRWDPLRIEQVVSSLVGNAIKYGDGKPVEIDLARADGVARLSIRDHGPGIDFEQQPRLFKRFERAASAQHFGGLGVGLWMVKEIVSAHGGEVRLESAPGEGAAFTVLLPFEPPQREASVN